MGLLSGRSSREINNTVDSAKRTSTKVEQLESEVFSLKQRLETVTFITHALYEILAETSQDFTEERLLDRVEKIRDREVSDYAEGKKPAECCGKCGRPIDKKQNICLYCGEPGGERGLFESLY